MHKEPPVYVKILLGIGTIVALLAMTGIGGWIFNRISPPENDKPVRQLSREYVSLSRDGLWNEANKYRTKPLVLDPVLNETAQKKCQKIATTGEAVHGDLRAELTHLDRKVYGENLAEGYTSPEQVVSAWAASPTHNENLRDPEWGRVGYGICNSTLLGVVVVQHFSD